MRMHRRYLVVIYCIVILPLLAHAEQPCPIVPQYRWSVAVEFPRKMGIAVATGLGVADNGDVLASLGKYPGNLYLIDGRTGKMRFSRESKGFIYGSDISADGSRIVFLEYGVSSQFGTDLQKPLPMLMLDRTGKVLWHMKASGIPKFSKSAKYLLTCSPIDVAVYRASDGKKLSRVVLRETSPMIRAAFTNDEKYIAVNTDNSAHLYTIEGARVWSLENTSVQSLSVSPRGDLTAFVPGFNKDGLATFVRLNRPGVTVTNIRTGISSGNDATWDAVGVSNDAKVVVMASHSPRSWEPQFPTGYIGLAAFNPTGKLLWTTPLATPEHDLGSLGVHALSVGQFAVTAMTSDGILVYFVGSSGKLLNAWTVAGKVDLEERFSDAGNYFAILSGKQVRLYPISPTK